MACCSESHANEPFNRKPQPYKLQRNKVFHSGGNGSSGGSKKLNEILIRNGGFSKTELTISEGESVSFSISSKRYNSQPEQEYEELDKDFTLDDVVLLQVVNDETEGKFRPVIGGYENTKLSSKCVFKFKLNGEYLFKLHNHPRNPPLLKIKVLPEQPLSIIITDDGFLPRIVQIDEGTSIKWVWDKLSIPHSIYEAEYCDKHCGIFRTSGELALPTLSNTYKRRFDDIGVFYFETEARNSDQKHVCIVEVKQSYSEHLVEIFDNKFSPARITIEEGDRVWFSWSKDRCLKKHCIYQIHPPSPEHPPDQAYLGVKNGFRWTAPTRNGMICHRFDKCGVYYFGDICGNECASYIGIIAVKQKPEQHIFNFNDSKGKFEQEIVTIETGDSVWWKWTKQILLTMRLLNATLLFDKRIDVDKCMNAGSENGCEQLDSDGLAKSGIYSYKFKKPGVYYFMVSYKDTENIITLVATSAQKDHKISITDNEAKPNILNIYPEDRVWFVWDDTRKSQNIRQVNHQNQIVSGGFLSGSLMEAPGTFVECFNDLGIFYYRSDNAKGILGAVVVVPEPTIQVVHAYEKGLNPDPLVIHTNDVVIWEFPEKQASDLVRIVTESDLYTYIEKSKELVPRRFLSRAFREAGVYHYSSPSFDNTIDPQYFDDYKGLHNMIISTIIVDKIEEYTSVLVDFDGFHPDVITVEMGKSVLFDWRDSNQPHNIIHVALPNEKFALRTIEGPAAFNSGKAVVNNSFLHTFEEEGIYCVKSDGAPNTYCIIKVLKTVVKTDKPKLVNQEPYVLHKNHRVYLNSSTHGAIIHYTLDGSTPTKLSALYLNEEGILMKEEGINIIRAVAFSENNLTSDIFTSSRFYVIPNPNEVKFPYGGKSSPPNDWWLSIPRLNSNSLGIGCAEAYWERPPPESFDLISHYQIFLNKVSYKNYISPNANRIVIKGLAGGRNYDLNLMVYPKSQKFVPQQSNTLTIRCSNMTNLGGPVISLKANPNPNQITIYWPSIDSPKMPIDYYELLINGEKKETIKPNTTKHKVTIEGCKTDVKYSIIVLAIPKDGSLPLISNELEVLLPLNLNEISLPDPVLRTLDRDYYDEYIEIGEIFDQDNNIIKTEEANTQYSNDPVKYTSYLSYDNYLIINRNSIISEIKKKESKSLQSMTNQEYILERISKSNINMQSQSLKSMKSIVEVEHEDKNKNISELSKAEIIESNQISLVDNNIEKKLISDEKKNSKESLKEKMSLNSSMSKSSIVPNIKQADLGNNIVIIEKKPPVVEIKNPVTITPSNRVTYDFPRDDYEIDEASLPVPKVEVSHLKSGTISVEWYMTKLPPHYLRLTHYVVTLVGNEFSNTVKSDASYECLMESNGIDVPAVQHSWITKSNSTNENKFVIDGILDTAIYQISVHAVYKVISSSSGQEYKKSSKVIIYTPLGPPNPPKLRVTCVEMNSVTLEWITQHYPRPEFVSGYRLNINGEPNKIFEKNVNEFLFTDMQPGKKYDIDIVTLANSIVGQSKPSNQISLICPMTPNSPLITQLPTVRPNSVVIGWKPVIPRTNNKWDQILFYKVFLNKKYHGEIYSSNITSYSYMICDLLPGKIYDVTVQSVSGEKITHPVDDPVVSCLVESELSNNLPCTPTAPPSPVPLRLASINTDGIEVTWPFPQQYGDATVSGYQLVRDGRLYGEIIPADVNLYKINDIQIGDTIKLQIISLTNHPVGKYTPLHEHPNYTMDQPQRELITNGVVNESRNLPKNRNTDINFDYPACKAGPILTVNYTGLVKPAVRVWTEKVTGYTAMVIYQTSKMNAHFIEPDYYLISYWPGNTPDDNVKTIRTDKDHVELVNLKPTTIYTVQVESRKEAKRSDDINDEKTEYKYIIYSKSNMTQFQTASPPDPPTNLSVVSTTCHAIKICWDPPVDHGSEIIATRVDCYQLNVEKPLHIFKELTADCRTCIIDNLSEKTSYRITVTAITEEYFNSHKIKELKQLPKLILESMPWLPSSSIEAMTSGTDPANNLEWKVKHDKSLGITWKPAKVYGTNRLVNQIFCYQEIGNTYGTMATQIPLPLTAHSFKMQNLKIGSKYKIWIEAVVLIKLNIDSETQSLVRFDDTAKFDKEVDHYRELKDSRCTNVASEALIMRVPAPCDPVILNLTGYSNETVDIYWAKPCLYNQHKDPDNPDQKIHLYRNLIGYRLEVNGIRQKALDANENTCTLTKCKPLNTYNIQIVALTCLTSAIDDKNSLIQNEVDINEIDESPSKPLQVKLFPDDRTDHLTSFSAKYEDNNEPANPKQFGRIIVDWLLSDHSDITQFNINWFSVEESITQRRSFDPSVRSCIIPVTKPKCVYEINLETVYNSGSVFSTERLFIEVPGSPDAPDLWLKEQKDNNVVIHWSEPRVYPNVPIAGYQLFLNDVKVGAKIEKDLVKATLPLKPNRSYKINLQALSSRPEFSDSIYSNSLNVTTSMMNTSQFSSNIEMLTAKNTIIESEFMNKFKDPHFLSLKLHYEQENERGFEIEPTIQLKVNKLTEDIIDFEWFNKTGNKNEIINEYKIEWHCLNTNEHFEHRCPPNINRYVIKKLKSGFSYCLKVFAIKNANTLVNRSKNIIMQMCAPPDVPILKLRACNFKYITMEWTKPISYGEAHVIAYKIFVDGKVEAVLSADQTIFTLSKGEPCHEYTFQVQAMTSDEGLTSPISAPLVVIWPGIMVPNLREIENEKGILRLGWDEPVLTGNIKISYYRVIAECEYNGQVEIVGPLDSNIHECEFTTLNNGKHKIYLEINAYGLTEPFLSKPIIIDFGSRPEAPILAYEIPGLEQRSKLDKIASSLSNKRDRLLKIVTNNQFKETHKNSVLPKAVSTLRQLDEALNDCLKLIGTYTGYFVVNLSWTCHQSQPSIRLLGYRVYVNGKQYGVDLHESIKSIRVKLSLERPVHTIYVTSFTDRPKLESLNSNEIELLSENFFPFTFYCYSGIHLKNISWPEKGCCAYQDTLPIERINLSKTRDPVNQGLLSEPIQALKCEVIDLITHKTRNLVEGRNKSGRFTLILFWTKWCLASIRNLNYLVMFARRNNSLFDYIACHYGKEITSEMVELLSSAGYLDNNVKFVNDIQYAGRTENTEVSSVESFDIRGVPTIVIVNKMGYIVWRGRHCSYDYSSFESFLNHTFSEVSDVRCSVNNCEICSGETSIEKELNELRSEQKYLNHYIDYLARPVQDAWTGIAVPVKSVPKLPKISTKQLISIKTNANPTASNRSGSERGFYHSVHQSQQLIRTYSLNSKLKHSSTDAQGLCYYKK